MQALIGISCASEDPTRELDARLSVRSAYVNALTLAGATPVLIPLCDDVGSLAAIWPLLNGLLLPGGGDIHPAAYRETPATQLVAVDQLRDRTEIWLAERAVADDLPLLAICRGLQVLNVACGGSLHQDIRSSMPNAMQHRCGPPEHRRDHMAHTVRIQRKSLLARVTGGAELTDSVPPLLVNSRHHQAIKVLGDGLSSVAVAPDGVVEAVEMRASRFILGVQWHPEDLTRCDEAARRMFRALVQAARTDGGH